MLETRNPAVARRRLRSTLRSLRGAAGLTSLEVSTALGWPPSRLVRVEGCEPAPSHDDVVQLCEVYGVSDADTIAQAVRLADDAAGMLYFEQHQDVLPPGFFEYLGFEAAATEIRHFELALVPGILQTERYARAALAAFAGIDGSENHIEQRVTVRLERKARLVSEDGARALFVIDEMALRRQVGDEGVMAEQVAELTRLAGLPHLSIVVLPVASGAHAGMTGPFVLLEFEDPADPAVLGAESLGDTTLRDDPGLVGAYADLFGRMERAAIALPDSGTI